MLKRPGLNGMRLRVTAVATVLAAILLVVMSLVVIHVLRTQLTENLDDTLRNRAATGVVDEDTVLRRRDGTVVGDIGHEPNWDTAGRELTTVRSLDRQPVPLRVLTTPDVQVAAALDDVTDPVNAVGWSFAMAVPGVLALLAALVWWLVGRTLRPVERIRAEMADITVHDLARRVPETGTGDEIDRLARTTNATLAQLESAVAQQQRLIADTSHELRSPLARIRAALEVDRANPTSADLAATHRAVLDDTLVLEQMIGDLLFLARSDAGAVADTFAPVDLDDIVRREAAGRSVRLELEPVQVLGHDGQLARAVRNLIDNAERHARTSVTIAVTGRNGTATVAVSDDGPGIPVSQREFVFERFARLDEARSAGSGGAGLGLAIVRDIVERHGGTVAVEGAAGNAVVIRLPVSGLSRAC